MHDVVYLIIGVFLIILSITIGLGPEYFKKEIKKIVKKENFPGESIASIMLLKLSLENRKIMMLILLTFLFQFIMIFKTNIDIYHSAIPIFIVLLIETKKYLMNYRIKKGYWGTNEYETIETICFILKNSEKIDFSDNDGRPKKLINFKDIEDEEIYPTGDAVGVKV
jgi:hypothetical protein